MTPRELIAEAWKITTTEPRLRRWAFTSTLFETMLNVKLLAYQLFFIYQHLRNAGKEVGFFDIEIWIWNNLPHSLSISILLFFVLLLVVEFFMPHFCLGAIIGLAAKRAKGQPVRGGFILAIYNFFFLFAIHEFLILSSLPTLITVVSLILRYIEGPGAAFGVVCALVLFAFGNIQKFLFAFAEEAVVIEKRSIFGAIGRSFKLILSNLSHIMFLLILMLIISLRIIINAVMVILIPGIMLGFGFFLTFFVSQTIAIITATILGLILIVIASYFLGYIHAFKQTVWTLTYLQLTEHKDLDEI